MINSLETFAGDCTITSLQLTNGYRAAMDYQDGRLSFEAVDALGTMKSGEVVCFSLQPTGRFIILNQSDDFVGLCHRGREQQFEQAWKASAAQSA